MRKSRKHGVPYYVQFRDHFAAMIEAGELAPGSRLPPERALAEKFSITRVTVRQTLIRMEADGLILCEDRRGWFIAWPRVRYDPTANDSFTDSVTEQGRLAGTKVLSKHRISAFQWESTHLGCAVGDPIFVVNRLRTVDGRAVLIEQIHIRAERCPDLLEYPLDQSMSDLMAEKYGIAEHRVDIVMRPTGLSEVQAKVLGVAVGTPSLYLSRTVLDQFNEIIEYDQEFWRHDAIDICVSAA